MLKCGNDDLKIALLAIQNKHHQCTFCSYNEISSSHRALLLLPLRRVSVQSIIFITEFEKVVGCLISDYCCAKSKLLQALCTMQTLVLMTILNSKEK